MAAERDDLGDRLRVLPAEHQDVRALTAAGWRVIARSWAAQLDADRIDRARLGAMVARVGPALVVRELESGDLRAVLALDAATVGDYPGSIATRHSALTVDTASLHPGRRAFGAWTPDGTLIGMTFVDRSGDDVETDFTVVAAAWRGRGVGSAVKAASVLALADEGARRFRTGGSSENAASIGASAALGYERDEEWVTLARS
ncbi:GNAT family N-acetyltransferase [Curtobacterium sp. ISL-83]|uniref:GNAT family N-acetyltransferase n=1 Tax=Curtobacterium sp. ISL-83 TaxID=2819145 RepID=UPI001BE681A8|nr:GNAT family N-acetyltransferase [Curtobacterium sp. ISL-83]MBT2503671.1 GNAT family N-acetyltransferase [Curtobacterium sp. ISL-83]